MEYTKEERKAIDDNFRLESAAPELLEACKEAYEELWKICQEAGLNPSHKTKAMIKIDEAIAKVEGK